MRDVAKIDVNPTKTNAATRRRQQIEIGFSPEQRHQDKLLPRCFSFSSIYVGRGVGRLFSPQYCLMMPYITNDLIIQINEKDSQYKDLKHGKLVCSFFQFKIGPHSAENMHTFIAFTPRTIHTISLTNHSFLFFNRTTSQNSIEVFHQCESWDNSGVS